MRVLLLGATSAIAFETARLLAKDGAEFFLVARNEQNLAAIRDDLLARGAGKVVTRACDLSCLEDHPGILGNADRELGGLDLALIAFGTLVEQKKAERDFPLLKKEIELNFLSVISLLTYIANYFEDRKHGQIAVITSVAGERGRQSNYIYGSAKGGVEIFLSGLRNRLHRAGVSVLTIKPGFVDTPMTAAFKKNFLFAKPESVAGVIYRAIKRKKDVVYAPRFWFFVMTVIRLIPEKIFKRLSL